VLIDSVVGGAPPNHALQPPDSAERGRYASDTTRSVPWLR
jgi:hypothetical protein